VEQRVAAFRAVLFDVPPRSRAEFERSDCGTSTPPHLTSIANRIGRKRGLFVQLLYANAGGTVFFDGIADWVQHEVSHRADHQRRQFELWNGVPGAVDRRVVEGHAAAGRLPSLDIHELELHGFPNATGCFRMDSIQGWNGRFCRLGIDWEQQGRQQQSECEHVGFCEMEQIHNAASLTCVGPFRRQTDIAAPPGNSRRLAQHRDGLHSDHNSSSGTASFSSTTADGDTLVAILASSRYELAVG
jgi:hypothetical protein